jgi:hypothetical protein
MDLIIAAGLFKALLEIRPGIKIQSSAGEEFPFQGLELVPERVEFWWKEASCSLAQLADFGEEGRRVDPIPGGMLEGINMQINGLHNLPAF